MTIAQSTGHFLHQESGLHREQSQFPHPEFLGGNLRRVHKAHTIHCELGKLPTITPESCELFFDIIFEQVTVSRLEAVCQSTQLGFENFLIENVCESNSASLYTILARQL